MKKPKFLIKLSAVLSPRPKKRLQASARAARPSINEYDDEEPTTKLSSAFVVVLILHVVAVGGIYAFNSIKASRKEREAAVPTEQSAPATNKNLAQNDPSPAAPPAAHQSAPAAHAAVPAPAPAAPIESASPGHQYQVKSGDNLTRIAFAYGVTPAAILEANHLKEGAPLKVGETLIIPSSKAAPKTTETHKPEASPKQTDVAPTSTTPGFYTVKKGDTPTSIAHKFGVTIQELLKANKITDPKKLQLGQTLKVPARNS